METHREHREGCLPLSLLQLSVLLVRQHGLAHEEEEHRADGIESRHGPEEYVLQLEAPLLDQIAHQRGRQRPKRRQSAVLFFVFREKRWVEGAGKMS